mmetsp:Transcript_2136/g.3135  ORF Transcript_2136/g.3135 Transcript_2136/m.3135 type:complete len:174 (-) Transcript_2136:84-605(-)|eukprot:CAMPEP_0113940360 /NCGR_PEP_ID=MMETSP1339-20121228/6504_1 /TAXON_ID=94617 /ORGANISM="Fibrocapsa japonica" /LENGTH=173 /DNA_ID=CAMNT_0000944163 /DNA_START=87 /DNA_END=608 /DNA_ORIENTATION=- /assembly_acc=CAM_ASM_000762
MGLKKDTESVVETQTTNFELPFSDDQIFSALQIAIIGWACLILFPRSKFTKPVVNTIIVMLCAIYTVLFLQMYQPDAALAELFGSLAGIMGLFKEAKAVLAGWTHFMVFDLFVGSWMSDDAAANGVSQIIMAPILILTLMFGPMGLGLYILIRAIVPKSGGFGGISSATKKVK